MGRSRALPVLAERARSQCARSMRAVRKSPATAHTVRAYKGTEGSCPFDVAYEEEVEDSFLAESILHQQLTNYRYDKRREFFRLPLKSAIEIVRKVVASMPAKSRLISFDR
jgi:hypothetical protein